VGDRGVQHRRRLVGADSGEQLGEVAQRRPLVCPVAQVLPVLDDLPERAQGNAGRAMSAAQGTDRHPRDARDQRVAHPLSQPDRFFEVPDSTVRVVVGQYLAVNVGRPRQLGGVASGLGAALLSIGEDLCRRTVAVIASGQRLMEVTERAVEMLPCGLAEL
jgi:hypothetical protein